MPVRDGQKMTEMCPDWAVPSRRWAWRAGMVFCALFWAGVVALLVL